MKTWVKWLLNVLYILTAFWAGGFTSMLLFLHSVAGFLTWSAVSTVACWPWYAFEYLWFLTTSGS